MNVLTYIHTYIGTHVPTYIHVSTCYYLIVREVVI